MTHPRIGRISQRRFIGPAVAVCAVALLLSSHAQAQPAPTGERLSLDAAVALALEHNRHVESARIQVEKADDEVAVARARRLPSFQTEAQASQLLTPVEFAFPRGAFGDFPGTGPIPASDTSVRVSRQPTFYVSSQISQPLSQLSRIGLGIQGAETARDIERERARAERLAVVNGVKRLYFAILQTESALAATAEAVNLYRELDRTLEVRVAQRVALRADALDVQYRLAQEELTRTTRQNTLASQKEQLNQLLGRDVGTTFDVDPVSTISLLEVDLESAKTRALDLRPDVREARLKVQQADLDRRIAKAERIPDVSLAASYMSNFNVDVLPRNLATLGVRATWEPFDWGRRGRELAVKSRVVSQARLAVREVEDKTVLEINARSRALAERRSALTVTEMAQRAVREKLRVKTNQYQIQAALLPDVLQVRAELATADDRYQQALLAFWTAKADLEYAVGEEGTP